jgi:alkyldihydroxyacetonephosphate synthase
MLPRRMGDRRRRLGGWGYEDESLAPSPQLLAWLAAQLGSPGAPIRGERVEPPGLAPRPVGTLPAATSIDPFDRLAHARGQGLPDVVRVRGGLVTALPDAVCRPASADEVAAVLARCAAENVRVIPWGGGTSVTGGVNVVEGDGPTVTLDLAKLSGLRALDRVSGLATFGAGTVGPDVEQALGAEGLTLGHYPQSWELSTVGGWVATRSSGQQSLGYGGIEGMVAGLESIAPGGRLRAPALPASAAGPDLRQWVLGSEGRFGVISEVTLRVRPRPELTIVEGALLPSFDAGVEAVRALGRAAVALDMLRLSDAPETQATLAASGSASGRLAHAYLRLRGIDAEGCLLLFGASGSKRDAAAAIATARDAVRRAGGVLLGGRPGRHWLRDRFRRPYLREALLDQGYATDTLETAVPWSAVAATRTRVGAAIGGALTSRGERVIALCHVSHTYVDGACLYFTFFYRAAEPRETVARWAVIKRAATDTIVDAGAALSHHHGVGQWHAPWYERDAGATGRALVEAVARQLDPRSILNPRVLLAPEDRLEL